MLCQNCGERNASVHLTKIINGEKNEVYLCEQCAREKGELNFATDPFSIQSLLSKFFKPDTETHTTGRRIVRPGTGQCDNCNMTLSEFGKVGKFGCSQCYDEFDPRVDELLRRIHGSDQHTGKVPERQGETILLKNKVKKLKKELQDAIATEEFEKAAELRDEIYDLKDKKNNSDEGEE